MTSKPTLAEAAIGTVGLGASLLVWRDVLPKLGSDALPSLWPFILSFGTYVPAYAWWSRYFNKTPISSLISDDCRVFYDIQIVLCRTWGCKLVLEPCLKTGQFEYCLLLHADEDRDDSVPVTIWTLDNPCHYTTFVCCCKRVAESPIP